MGDITAKVLAAVGLSVACVSLILIVLVLIVLVIYRSRIAKLGEL